MAVGVAGGVARSADGQSWSLDAELTECTVKAVDAVGPILVAVGRTPERAGCLWRSEDHGESWTRQDDLDRTVKAVVGGDTWLAVGDEGRLSWSLDDGRSWSRVILSDDRLLDVQLHEGTVKVLGQDWLYTTDNFLDVEQYDTAGFLHWSADVGGSALLAMTEDGDVYAAPEGEPVLVDWRYRGSAGRGESGVALNELAWWVR